MTNILETLRQALEALGNCESMLPEYHQWLSDAQYQTKQAIEHMEKAELVFAFRRKGQDAFCTCDKTRYEELSEKPQLFEMAIFHPAPAIPEGWQLVPKEPTKEQIQAIEKQWLYGSHIDMARREYKAMLSAAPEAPK